MRTLSQALTVAAVLNTCEVRPESSVAAQALICTHDSDWIVLHLQSKGRWLVRNIETGKLYDPAVAMPLE